MEQSVTKTKPLDIIVFQTVPNMLESIEYISKEMREHNPGNYPNETFYTSNPMHVLERVASDMENKQGPIVISSQQMYSGEGIQDLAKKLLDSGFRIEGTSQILSAIKDKATCNYLAAYVKSINPNAWFFRCSSDPSLNNDFLTGDIPKEDIIKIVEFINCPLLPAFYSNKDFKSLQERFPQIKLYEKPKNNSPLRFIAAG
jgi:hypothetical protein